MFKKGNVLFLQTDKKYIDDVMCMFIIKPHPRDWIDNMHELTQYPYTVIIECTAGFSNHGTGPAGAHAYCGVIFCSDDLFCPVVTSMVPCLL